MALFHLFSSFLPLENPIGFGASDFIEFALAALLVSLVLFRPGFELPFRRLAKRTGWCMLLLALLPVALRLALLPHHPIPTPDLYDEFSHLLVADTLRHFRLANPMHPMHQFFETFFVLQEPSYSSIYPIGQGMALALGWTIFGHPWAGVVLSGAVFCALCYWMLSAWTTPSWALVGGLLAVFEFGPLNLWMNSYWGGAVSASAGCLVFGALPRLQENGRTRDAVWLGLGLGIHLLTRPYESVFLVLSVVLFFLPALRMGGELPRLARIAVTVILAVLPAIAIMLVQNKQVTGSWTTLPYILSQYQYGVPAALTFQSHPIPHRELTPQQQLDYRMQLSFGPAHGETIGTYLARLAYRVRFYRFFFFPPLYLALLVFVVTVREFRFFWVLLTFVLFALGVNFFPAFQFHYLGAVVCLLVLMSVKGLERLNLQAARLIVFLCVAHFVFWYSVHLFENVPMMQYETWDTISHQNPARRILIRDRLAKFPGKQLVFVRYSPHHIFSRRMGLQRSRDRFRARGLGARPGSSGK